MGALRRGLEPVAADASVDEVVRPDVAFVCRPKPHARSIIQPQPPAFGLLLRDFQPFTAPYAIDALLIHMPAVSPQKFRDPAIAVSAELSGEPDDRFCQRRLVTTRCFGLALRRAMLTDHAASPAL
jgi:hypothetical protein